MKVLVTTLSVLIGFTLVSCQSEEREKLTPEYLCSLVQEGQYVKDVQNCSVYYKCVEAKPVKYSCPEGNVFDKERIACIKSNHCDPFAERRCIDKVKGFVPDSQSCAGFYYCTEGRVFGRGQCPQFQVFNPDVLDGSCVWEEKDKKCNNELNICEYLKSGEYFGSSDNCGIWRQCNDGQLESGNCGANLVLDLSDGFCAAEGDCRQTKKSDKPLVKPPPPKTITCAANSPQFIRDGATCSGYYWCPIPGGPGQWGQCASNRFFNGRTCVDRTSVACEYDRCEGMGPGITWVNINGDGCTGYNYCEDGVFKASVKPGKCSSGWFDERLQRCVRSEVRFAACAKPVAPPPPGPPGPGGVGPGGAGTGGAGNGGAGAGGVGPVGPGGAGTGGAGNGGAGAGGTGPAGPGGAGTGGAGPAGPGGAGTGGAGNGGAGAGGTGPAGPGGAGAGGTGQGGSGQGGIGQGGNGQGGSGQGGAQ